MDSSMFVQTNTGEGLMTTGLEGRHPSPEARSGRRSVVSAGEPVLQLPVKVLMKEPSELDSRAAGKLESNASIRNSEYRRELESRLKKVKNVDKTARDCFLECQNRLLEQYHVSRQTLEAWQKEANQLGLKADPLIAAIADPNQAKAVRALELRFQSEGVDKFGGEEFRICLENCLIYIDALKAKHIKDKEADLHLEEKLNELFSQVSEELNNKKILYKNVLILAFKCSELFTVVTNFDNDSNERRINRATFALALDPEAVKTAKIDDEAVASGVFDDLPLECWSKERLFWSQTLGYMRAIFNHEHPCKNRLVWPAFDVLSLDFFVEKSKFNIDPAGLLPLPVAFHDNTAMNPSFFYNHDWAHIHFHWFSLTCYDDFAGKEEVLAKIRSLKCANPSLSEAITLLLFDYLHEQNYRVLSLKLDGAEIQEDRQVNGSNGFAGRIWSKGLYNFDLGKEDIIKACLLLIEQFPQPAVVSEIVP